MKASLPFKTLLRSPARTALTLVLLAAVSFAFFTCMAEYAVTSREFKNAALQYRGVDAAEDGVGGAAGSHAAGQEVGALAIAHVRTCNARPYMTNRIGNCETSQILANRKFERIDHS